MTAEEDAAIQEEYLERAADAPSYVVVRTIWELLERRSDIRLDPRWRPIWESVREEVIRDSEAPEAIVSRVDQAVRAIESIDPEVEQIRLKPEEHVCLLLGAGASAPAPSSIPTVRELLPELWRRARKLGREDIDRLAGWCESRRITNIEDLLTAAYLANFAAKSASVSGLLDYFLFRERNVDDLPSRLRRRSQLRPVSEVDAASVALFQETLQGLFGLLTGTMIPARPNAAHEGIVAFVKTHTNSSLVTTNYDGCVDEALLTAGVPFHTHLGPAAQTTVDRLHLVKIHGSINWSYCESCHDAREFDLLGVKRSYEQDTASYAVVGICKKCGGQRKPLLIPPMGIKFLLFPNLITLWNTARERIESARYVVVVGFSFSEADSYINRIIERSMSFHRDQTIVICDPNPGLALQIRSRFVARIDSFEPKRVLAIVGSADQLIPSVLQTWLSESPPPPLPVSPRPRRPRRRPS